MEAFTYTDTDTETDQQEPKFAYEVSSEEDVDELIDQFTDVDPEEVK
jgi:hypothetical protein